jgi:hypothetical protein
MPARPTQEPLLGFREALPAIKKPAKKLQKKQTKHA